jgi:Domain of unknown function (DUF4145)
MSLLVADCPRCGASKITFDVAAQVYRSTAYGWKDSYEIFSLCRSCSSPTIFLVSIKSADPQLREAFRQQNAFVSFPKGLNQFFDVDGFISLRDNSAQKSPEHLPKEIEDIFKEGAACLEIRCNNAAATMFRLCVDLTTRPLLPDPEDSTKPQPNNSKTRRDLGLRLTWLFDNGILPTHLRELAKCIREDANDGAHVGTLTKQDAEDLLDFTTALLERLFTEPKRLQLAEERRKARRSSGAA